MIELKMDTPRDRKEVAALAGCKRAALALLPVGRGRRSWRIPIFRPGPGIDGKVMSLLWCPEGGTITIQDGIWRAHRPANYSLVEII